MKLPFALSWSDRFRADADPSEIPVHTLLDVVRIPSAERTTPWALMARRFGYAAMLVVAVATVVYFDKEGYTERLTFIDDLYYSAGSLSTTG